MKWRPIKLFLMVALLMLMVVLSALYLPQINLKSTYFDDIEDQSTLQWLHDLPPFKIDVMANRQSRAGGYVANFLSPLNDYWSSLEVHYYDPAEHPELVREYGIKARGEMVVRYQDRQFVLSNLSYETLFNGLQGLFNPEQGWVVILEGFESQSLSPQSTDGLGLWVDSLQQLNYSVAAIKWHPELSLPTDVEAIILPDPKQPLSNEAINWIQERIKRGVNLWWLTNPKNIHQQPELTLMFDVMPAQAVIDKISALKSYPSHAITKQFSYPTTWRGITPLVSTEKTVLSSPDNQTFAVSREIDGARLLVLSDSDFINNELLNSGGNRALSLRMLDWVMHQDERIYLPDLSAQQKGLFLDTGQALWVSAGLLIMWPSFWLLCAILIWIKNRRMQRQE